MLPVISDPESLSTRADSRSGTAADSQFDVLADRRRRAVLRYLEDSEGPVSLSDLADHLVLEDHADDEGALASAGDALFGTRRRVQISLRHSHLPNLADAGAVDFDYDANAVALRERGLELLTGVEATAGAGAEHGRVEPVSETSTQ